MKDGGHAEFLARHLVDDLRHWSGACDLGQGIAGVHDLSDSSEAPADAASGMEVGEVFGLPSATPAHFEGEGVAEGKHHGRGGGGREVERAGFGGDASVEEDVACLCQSRSAASADGDKSCIEAFESGKQPEKLLGFTAVGERENGVVGGEHAEVAVDRFGSVQEVGGCAGGAKRGGDFACNDATLADAGNDDAAAAVGGLKKQIGRLSEGGEHGGVEAKGELCESGCLDSDELRWTDVV